MFLVKLRSGKFLKDLHRVEELLVAEVAEELLIVFVERSRVERLPAGKAFDTTAVVGFAIRGHHLESRWQS